MGYSAIHGMLTLHSVVMTERGSRYMKRLLATSMLLIVTLCTGVDAYGQLLNASTKALTISPNQLSFYMRGHAKVLGDRLFKPGNERVTLVGSLSSAGQAAIPVTILYDITGKVRMDEAGRSIGFDGNAAWATGNSAPSDNDLLEAIALDSAEHLFQGQAQRLATRFLGRAFRFDDGTDVNYKGPYYDVLMVTDTTLGSTQPQIRVYCINSRTYLLERVQQDTIRSGKKTRIETVLTGWQNYGSQLVPTSVIRYQDGQQIFALTVTTATTGPTTQDGRFNAPKP